jgi:tetratricopeptide (TPR) repeat protein
MSSVELLSADPDELERRHDELDALLEGLAERRETGPALAAARGLVDFWMRKGHLAEGRRQLDGLLAAGDAPPEARAAGLAASATLAFRQGDDDAARHFYEESAEVARSAGDDGVLAWALGGLSRVALRAGECARTRELAQEALGLALDEASGLGARHMLAAAARCEGDYQRAEELYGETLELSRRLGARSVEAGELLNLGFVALHVDERERALERFRQSLELAAELDDDYLTPYCLIGAGTSATIRGDNVEAARLLSAAKAAFDATGAAIDPGSAEEFDAHVAHARRELGEEFDTVWAEGRRLTPADALARTQAAA